MTRGHESARSVRSTPPDRVDSEGCHGVWRSLVARFVRDEEAAGSNPVTPTQQKGSAPFQTLRSPSSIGPWRIETMSNTAPPLLVAFDLDDTLAPSKSAIDPRIGDLLIALAERVEVAIISGGQIVQFRTQVVDRLPDASPEALLRHIHLMPTCGTQYYRLRADGFEVVYAHVLSDDEKSRALAAVEEEARRLDLWESEPWGDILEDRGSQITFSALGQRAPLRREDGVGSHRREARTPCAPPSPSASPTSRSARAVRPRSTSPTAASTRRTACASSPRRPASPLDGHAVRRRPPRPGRQRLPRARDGRRLPRGRGLGGHRRVSSTPCCPPSPRYVSSRRCAPRSRRDGRRTSSGRRAATRGRLADRHQARQLRDVLAARAPRATTTPSSVMVRSISLRRIAIVRSTPCAAAGHQAVEVGAPDRA